MNEMKWNIGNVAAKGAGFLCCVSFMSCFFKYVKENWVGWYLFSLLEVKIYCSYFKWTPLNKTTTLKKNDNTQILLSNGQRVNLRS